MLVSIGIFGSERWEYLYLCRMLFLILGIFLLLGIVIFMFVIVCFDGVVFVLMGDGCGVNEVFV